MKVKYVIHPHNEMHNTEFVNPYSDKPLTHTNDISIKESKQTFKARMFDNSPNFICRAVLHTHSFNSLEEKHSMGVQKNSSSEPRTPSCMGPGNEGEGG